MDHFVMFPVNENGVFWQPEKVGPALQDAMSSPPFPFEDVFVYSHGWWTIANQAMVQYGQFSIEFTKNLLSGSCQLQKPPKHSFGMGIHWPSTLSEDMAGLSNALQVTTYYQMGARSEQVGYAGLYATLLLMFKARYQSNKMAIETAAANHVPLPGIFRLNIIGHSFGCRVVSSALQRLIVEINKPNIEENFARFVKETPVNLVLLQAALKRKELDEIGNYDKLVTLPNLKMLVTTSRFDTCLIRWFPLAEAANNIVHLSLADVMHDPKPNAIALGGGINPKQTKAPFSASLTGGPTARTWETFGESPLITNVAPGFKCADVPINRRLVVADLSDLHQARADAGLYQPDSFGGSHSDISSPELYSLISGFCFN